MNKTDKEYIINEVGMTIAREKLAKIMRETNLNNCSKKKLYELISDRDELDKGNVKIINKYMGDIKYE